MLQSLVQLVVQVGQPKFAVLGRSLSRHRLHDLYNLLQVGLPKLPVVQKVDIHELIDHLDDAAVDVAEFAILRNEVSGLGLHLLVVLLDLNRVIPCHHPIVDATGALGVLD